MSEENNYTIWSFLKKCHDRGLIYRGYDAMPWCPRCGVGLSQMEMNEGLSDSSPTASVFVQVSRCATGPGENLLVWTTTPWTLTSNVGAAVNPELTYLKVQHKERDLLRRQRRVHGRSGCEEQVQDEEGVGARACRSSRRSSSIFKEKKAATRSSAR